MDTPKDVERPSGQKTSRGGGVPRGVEVLIKKAAVDPAFKALLLERRAGAAAEIGLELAPAEEAMLAAIPAAQLEATIDTTTVEPKNRRAFMGKAAALMLAAVGGALLEGCDDISGCQGIREDRPPPKPTQPAPTQFKPAPQITRGVQFDRPPPKTPPADGDAEKPAELPGPTGSRPDRPEGPPMSKGHRIDRPKSEDS